jgi:methionyl-tRNA formyltransferase
MVVVGYGQIIPQSIIDIPPHGIVNVHASLLPKYRGAGPVQWAIANGETRTGVTTMRIDAGLDTGDMLLKAETEIGPEETAVELGARLAVMGAALLVETLANIAVIAPQKQDPTQATYAPLLKKEDGLIDWHRPAQAIHNRVRGFQPWPGAYTRFRGQQLAHLEIARGSARPRPPGRLLLHPLRAVCGEGALELIEVQLEGRKRMPPKPSPTASASPPPTFWDNRKVDLPLGYRYAATYAGIRQAEKDDLGSDRLRPAGRRRRRIHPKPRAGRAGQALPPPSGRLARRGGRQSW